jgi:cytochrome c-type biogenesis protein CcmH/NrfF
MKRHSFDPLSFVFGAFFVVMAAAAAFRDEIDWTVGLWVLPASILVLGIGLLASSLRVSKTEE